MDMSGWSAAAIVPPSMVLFMTGLGIGVEALTDVLKGEYSHLQVPGNAGAGSGCYIHCQ